MATIRNLSLFLIKLKICHAFQLMNNTLTQRNELSLFKNIVDQILESTDDDLWFCNEGYICDKLFSLYYYYDPNR